MFAQFDLWRSNWEEYYTYGDDISSPYPGEGGRGSYGPPPPYPEYSQYSDVNFLIQVII